MKEIICNMCANTIKSNMFGYIDDHLSIEKRWSYGSSYDNEIHSINICEPCYKDLIHSFIVKPTILNN